MLTSKKVHAAVTMFISLFTAIAFYIASVSARSPIFGLFAILCAFIFVYQMWRLSRL